MQSKTEWATIGLIVAPFGIRGEIKVFSLSDIPDRFTQLKAIYLQRDNRHIAYTIKTVRPYKGDMVILKLEGIDDANAVEDLRNLSIVIPMDELAKLPPDSYYLHDIIGLHVTTLNGQQLGAIVDVIATGSNDVYIVKSEEGREVLIPAIKDVVKQVDLIRQMMYIDPIKGLLEEDEAVVDRSDEHIADSNEEEE